MLKNPPVVHRIAYCLVVLGAILPIGITASSWVALARGPSLGQTIPYVGPILLATVGLFRVYLVARFPATLCSLPVSGIAVVMRVLGLIAIYIGVIATILGWIARPLMRAVLTSRTESGAEFFIVGVYLSLLRSSGLLGILLFEFSRLLGFEKLARERNNKKGGV